MILYKRGPLLSRIFFGFLRISPPFKAYLRYLKIVKAKPAFVKDFSHPMPFNLSAVCDILKTYIIIQRALSK